MAGRPEATEKATPKRQREARERGQVAKSPDVTAALGFLTAVIVLHLTLPQAFDAIGAGVTASLEHLPTAHRDLTIRDVAPLVVRAAGGLVYPGIALMATMTIIAILGNVLQFGLLVSFKPIAPSFAKINPLAGVARLLSPASLVSLVKQIAKLAAVFVLVYVTVREHLGAFAALSVASPRELVMFLDGVLFTLGLRFGALLLVIGAADYAYQRKRIADALKMTKQEVRDEQRQSENPEVKSAVRKRQREMARRRMMAAVPTATVLVTNPTHFAVALKWDELKMDAPVVVAKGADLVAKRMRRIATDHGVPVMENPPLARALYAEVPLDTPIPPSLYSAVAQVIAFVFKMQKRTIA